ncbi:hypothetical protein HD554DRAFT_1528408 [Boletus coccyginus]|nr:hypothetical protein HD554DRAFT_1528408 [Boletus coccyginus]
MHSCQFSCPIAHIIYLLLVGTVLETLQTPWLSSSRRIGKASPFSLAITTQISVGSWNLLGIESCSRCERGTSGNRLANLRKEMALPICFLSDFLIHHYHHVFQVKVYMYISNDFTSIPSLHG